MYSNQFFLPLLADSNLKSQFVGILAATASVCPTCDRDSITESVSDVLKLQ